MSGFTHLHVHTQYSILDGASAISSLMKKAKADGMKAIAITDHGNMFGVKEFHNYAKKEEIKPIIGCEVYVAQNSRHLKKGKENLSGNHLILLAKNKQGYHNLIKLVSYGFTEGFYSKARIDKELLRKYHEGLIVSTSCLGGEIPQYILNNDLEKAEQTILEFKELFGDDFYLELQRHPTIDQKGDKDIFPLQQKVNKHLLEFSAKFGIKTIATNDVHFINQEDAQAHDILICLNTGTDLTNEGRMKYTRQEWFKTQEEMSRLFEDVPEALANTIEITDKIETYDITNKPVMPNFPIPDGFENADRYLEFLTYEGAKKRYVEITNEVKERIDFELSVISHMGFPGYFLIVQDFIAAARERGVAVGPGRGSAAGSAVAYCLRITDIDPIKYDLLFERFLNPDRISMPDIDIDFDDDGRDMVIEYVTNKYGKEKVAHIITFGSMAAKSAIRDVARVLKLSLSEADRLAKLVPDGPNVTLKSAYETIKELSDAKKSVNPLIVETLKYAGVLEGSVRNTGIHACGIIIGKDDLTNYIPISIAKEKDDKEVLVTQYEGKFVEDIGMLKMDFLGLKTLSIIKDALENIKLSKKIDVDIENVKLDDSKTYELYSKGETTGTFQFESEGMKKYLRELKPNKFEDLIAMNALYRPGPMEYIPSFIARKIGKEPIVYDFPLMEKRLKDTYGITVYQEQVMLLSRDMAGFSRGDSDKLRKAMGKKQKDVMDTMKVKFVEGCKKNGLEEEKINKVWGDWEKFAEYGFNKCHSTCYSFVAYQTAYLKANYPGEYMAAVLSRNISDIKKITSFMDECRRMGMNVLGPDVNESHLKFTVNTKGNIRFGLGAIKGVGGNAVNHIVEERQKNGTFKNIYDFVERLNLTIVNKKNMEALVTAGAFDAFTEINRGQYFVEDEKAGSFIESLIRYGNKMQTDKNTTQQNLFEGTVKVEMVKPEIPHASSWTKLEQLNKERDVIGIYLSAHPLDAYRLEFDNLCTHTLADMADLNVLKGKEITIAGMITSARFGLTKNNKNYGSIMLEDFNGNYKMNFFGKDFIEYKNYLTDGYSLMIKGKVQPRTYGDTHELEFKISKIILLEEARKELCKSISLKVPVSSISDDFIDNINKFVSQKTGNVILKFIIYDPIDNIKVDMFSRSQRIGLTNNFIDYLKTSSEIEYKIN